MCGIAGIFNINQEPVSNSVLDRILSKLAHRGPDGRDSYIDQNIGLAHHRLAIIDPSNRSAQPMTSYDNNWIVVFNGCIYNYRELKIQLKASGISFQTSSDTEVLVEGIAKFGIDFIKKLNGMFAIAAWNREKRELFLSRDRYGVKPLYYWNRDGKSVVFASEIKAIIEHPEYKIDLNPAALNEYFTFQNVFRYHTLFKDITMLPPANTVKISQDSYLRHHSWWDYDFTQPDESIKFNDAQRELTRLFKNAVSKQMVADVPVGSYLSGGMDSGSITAIASSQVERLATFTCGFDMSEVTGIEANYDERRDAELMANHFKTEHYEQIMNAGDLSWSLPKVVWHLEDLRVGMSYPNYYISRLASKFVKVCLQGTGGDELFGGYPWRYYRVFKSLNQQEFFDSYYEFWKRLVPDESKSLLFTSDIQSKIDINQPRKDFEHVFTFNDRLKYDTPEQHIQNSLYFEVKTFLPGLLLVGDKLSMANGLEERFPFLDNDLVDFAQKIPVRYKLGNLESMKRLDENTYMKKKKAYQEFDDGKNVLRKAMKDLIPDKIINRKKQGFSAPDESWYRGANATYIKELLLDKQTISSEFIDRKYINNVVNEHLNQKVNNRLLIWSFMNFEWWCRIFLDNQKI